MKTRQGLITGVTGIAIVVGAYWLGCYHTTNRQVSELPTIMEVQAMLGCENIDGVIGEETKRLWKLAINQQYASRSDYMYAEPNENAIQVFYNGTEFEVIK